MKKRIVLLFESILFVLSVIWVLKTFSIEAFITFTGSLSALIITVFFKGKKDAAAKGTITMRNSNRNIVVNENHGNIQINSYSDESV